MASREVRRRTAGRWRWVVFLVAVCCAARVCGERKITWLIPEEELSKIHPSAEPTPGGEQEREREGGGERGVGVRRREMESDECDCSKFGQMETTVVFLLTLR